MQERVQSDKTLTEGGAEYVQDSEQAPPRLEVTAEQVQAANEEMEEDFSRNELLERLREIERHAQEAQKEVRENILKQFSEGEDSGIQEIKLADNWDKEPYRTRDQKIQDNFRRNKEREAIENPGHRPVRGSKYYTGVKPAVQEQKTSFWKKLFQ